MKHVDPAHYEFDLLAPRERAKIYSTVWKWKTSAIADELGVASTTVLKWLDPDYAERQRAAKRASDARARERKQSSQTPRIDRRRVRWAERSATPVTCPSCQKVHLPRLSDLKKSKRACAECQGVWVRNYYERQRAKAQAGDQA